MMFHKMNVKPQNNINPAYQKAPLIAFEFAKKPADINALFLQKDGKTINVAFMEKMEFINTVDFGFILSYTLLLAFFSLTISKQNMSGLGYFGVLIAVLVGVGDVFENIKLFEIMEKITPTEDYQPELSSLNFWTWTKWGLLGILMVVLLPCLIKTTSSIYSILLGIVMGIVAILGLVAFITQCPTWISRYTSLIFIPLFPLLIIYSLARWKMWLNS
jgi:hypothetical protein